MKAVICPKYGPPEVLKISEVDKPVPKNKEVLIKVHATSVHIGDTKIRRFEPGLGFIQDMLFKPIMRFMLGFRGPRKKILGMELSGVIEEVGKEVTLFKKGDQIFASTGMHFGAYAEYACLPEDATMALKPSNLSFEESAPISNGALTALLILKKASIRKGQRIMIYGASGSVGTFAVQLAKNLGAEVTAVCSTPNVKWVKTLGADKVFDYTRSDFEKMEEKYDLIFDAVGKLKRLYRKKFLKKGAKYLNVLSASNGLKFKAQDLGYIKDLCEAGKLKPVIDKKFMLEKMVEAHAYVEKGHKKGHVVIEVNSA